MTNERTTSRTARSSFRRAIRILLIAVPTLVAAVLIGHVIAHELALRELRAPGRFVSVDGRRAHLVEAGVEHRGQGPSVILETGWSGMSIAWQHVLEDLGQTHYVIAYDRPGHGLSQDVDGPRDGDRIAAELQGLLEADDVPEPYILVGHSLGGPYVRAFTGAHRESVAAVVLVDSTHPDQLERSASLRRQVDETGSFLALLPDLARFGVVRALGIMEGSANGLTGDAHRWAVEMLADADHLAAARAEMESWDASMEAARRAGRLGAMPLHILIAGDTSATSPDFATLQHEMVELSDRAVVEVVEGADHFSIVMDPGYASRVAAAVRLAGANASVDSGGAT